MIHSKNEYNAYIQTTIWIECNHEAQGGQQIDSSRETKGKCIYSTTTILTVKMFHNYLFSY